MSTTTARLAASAHQRQPSASSAPQPTHFITVIKRSGADGPRFPLTTSQCRIGSAPNCDIRIQLPQIADVHATLSVDERNILWLTTPSVNATTTIIRSGEPNYSQQRGDTKQRMRQSDVIQVGERQFRLTYAQPPMASPAPVAKHVPQASPVAKLPLADSTNQRSNATTPTAAQKKAGAVTAVTATTTPQHTKRLSVNKDALSAPLPATPASAFQSKTVSKLTATPLMSSSKVKTPSKTPVTVSAATTPRSVAKVPSAVKSAAKVTTPAATPSTTTPKKAATEPTALQFNTPSLTTAINSLPAEQQVAVIDAIDVAINEKVVDALSELPLDDSNSAASSNSKSRRLSAPNSRAGSSKAKRVAPSTARPASRHRPTVLTAIEEESPSAAMSESNSRRQSTYTPLKSVAQQMDEDEDEQPAQHKPTTPSTATKRRVSVRVTEVNEDGRVQLSLSASGVIESMLKEDQTTVTAVVQDVIDETVKQVLNNFQSFVSESLQSHTPATRRTSLPANSVNNVKKAATAKVAAAPATVKASQKYAAHATADVSRFDVDDDAPSTSSSRTTTPSANQRLSTRTPAATTATTPKSSMKTPISSVKPAAKTPDASTPAAGIESDDDGMHDDSIPLNDTVRDLLSSLPSDEQQVVADAMEEAINDTVDELMQSFAAENDEDMQEILNSVAKPIGRRQSVPQAATNNAKATSKRAAPSTAQPASRHRSVFATASDETTATSAAHSRQQSAVKAPASSPQTNGVDHADTEANAAPTTTNSSSRKSRRVSLRLDANEDGDVKLSLNNPDVVDSIINQLPPEEAQLVHEAMQTAIDDTVNELLSNFEALVPAAAANGSRRASVPALSTLMSELSKKRKAVPATTRIAKHRTALQTSAVNTPRTSTVPTPSGTPATTLRKKARKDADNETPANNTSGEITRDPDTSRISIPPNFFATPAAVTKTPAGSNSRKAVTEKKSASAAALALMAAPAGTSSRRASLTTVSTSRVEPPKKLAATAKPTARYVDKISSVQHAAATTSDLNEQFNDMNVDTAAPPATTTPRRTVATPSKQVSAAKTPTTAKAAQQSTPTSTSKLATNATPLRHTAHPVGVGRQAQRVARVLKSINAKKTWKLSHGIAVQNRKHKLTAARQLPTVVTATTQLMDGLQAVLDHPAVAEDIKQVVEPMLEHLEDLQDQAVEQAEEDADVVEEEKTAPSAAKRLSQRRASSRRQSTRTPRQAVATEEEEEEEETIFDSVTFVSHLTTLLQTPKAKFPADIRDSIDNIFEGLQSAKLQLNDDISSESDGDDDDQMDVSGSTSATMDLSSLALKSQRLKTPLMKQINDRRKTGGNVNNKEAHKALPQQLKRAIANHGELKSRVSIPPQFFATPAKPQQSAEVDVPASATSSKTPSSAARSATTPASKTAKPAIIPDTPTSHLPAHFFQTPAHQYSNGVADESAAITSSIKSTSRTSTSKPSDRQSVYIPAHFFATPAAPSASKRTTRRISTDRRSTPVLSSKKQELFDEDDSPIGLSVMDALDILAYSQQQPVTQSHATPKQTPQAARQRLATPLRSDIERTATGFVQHHPRVKLLPTPARLAINGSAQRKRLRAVNGSSKLEPKDVEEQLSQSLADVEMTDSSNKAVEPPESSVEVSTDRLTAAVYEGIVSMVQEAAVISAKLEAAPEVKTAWEPSAPAAEADSTGHTAMQVEPAATTKPKKARKAANKTAEAVDASAQAEAAVDAEVVPAVRKGRRVVPTAAAAEANTPAAPAPAEEPPAPTRNGRKARATTKETVAPAENGVHPIEPAAATPKAEEPAAVIEAKPRTQKRAVAARKAVTVEPEVTSSSTAADLITPTAASTRGGRARKASVPDVAATPLVQETPVTATRATRGRKTAAEPVAEPAAEASAIAVEPAVSEPATEARKAGRKRKDAQSETATAPVEVNASAPPAVQPVSAAKPSVEDGKSTRTKRGRNTAAAAEETPAEVATAATPAPTAAAETTVTTSRRGKKQAAVVEEAAPVVKETAAPARRTRTTPNTPQKAKEEVKEVEEPAARATRTRARATAK